MAEEIIFTEKDRIAVIAPHPDDECLGAAAALLKATDRTDIYVLTDGSHGCEERSIEEELAIRKRQFEAEMEYLQPHAWYWLGVEDTKLKEHREVAQKIDFTQYTKIFLPWLNSVHPDHVAAAQMCCNAIRSQGSTAECYSYEIYAPFYYPSYYIDITDLEEQKRKLVRFHEDQAEQEQIIFGLNAFRAAQMIDHSFKYVECYEKVDVYARPDTPDVLFKLYALNEDPEIFAKLDRLGIQIKRVMPMNTTKVYEFIRDNFALSWADECMPSIMNGGCYVAVRGREILGFMETETPARGFVGPIGVLPEARRNGIARALTLTCMKAMREKGYQYAVCGMVHPWEIAVAKSIAEIVCIPDSAGSYRNML